MTTKNCKLIIDTIISLGPDERYKAHLLGELAEKVNISAEQIEAACEELARDGLAQVRHLDYGPVIITLTEAGVNYKQKRWQAIRHYILLKWIDFLALVVAVIALIVSIIALNKP